MDERASSKRALAATPSPSRRRRRRVATGSSPGCVPRVSTPLRAFRTPPPRRLLPPTSAASTPGLPRAPRLTPALRLDDDDDAFSVISGDASPGRDSHVLDFLALGDGAQGFTLFTPSPAAPKTAASARGVKRELAACLLTPQASPVRSAKNVSPSHFFRSPFNKSRTNSAASSPLHLQPRARDAESKDSSTDDGADENDLGANRGALLSPRSSQRQDDESEDFIKSEPLVDVTTNKASSESRSTSSTPSSSSSLAWRRNSLSLLRTPSPATSARARALRTRTQLLLSGSRDPFASSDEDVESPRKIRRLVRGREDEDEFNRPPSAASGANEQDWLFSFANTLSPLAPGSVNDEDLETSFMTLRFSPAVPSSIDLQRLLPPFPSPGLGPSEPTNIFRTAATPKSPAQTIPSRSPSPRLIKSEPASSRTTGEATASSAREVNESFPNIRASTSATPGRDERLKVSSSSVMKMKLHVTFDQFPPSHTKREIEAINNSIKRRKNSRKRKLEDTKSRHVRTNSKGLNVQRKLLQTPMKEDEPTTEKFNSGTLDTKGKLKLSKTRSSHQGITGRTAQRKILDAVEEVADKDESAPDQANASGKASRAIEPSAAAVSAPQSDEVNSTIRRRVSATLVSVSTATLPSNLAAAVSTPSLQPLKLRKPAVNPRPQPSPTPSFTPAAKIDASTTITTTKPKSSDAASMKPVALQSMTKTEGPTSLNPPPISSSTSSVVATQTTMKPSIGQQKLATGVTPLPASKGGFVANPKILSTPTQQPSEATPPPFAAGPVGIIQKKKTPCNCKKSKCLKLYCECFASGGYCDESCNCVDCANTPASEAVRQQAIASRLEKNPNAFKPKIESTVATVSSTTPGGGVSHQIGVHGFTTPNNHHHHHLHGHGHGMVAGDVKKMHKHGCHCKKSACQKRYCECFQAGVPCGDNCRCIDCKNQSPYVTKNANIATPLSAISIRGPASRESLRTNLPLAAAGVTPGANGEQFVSPPVPSIRQRLRIDRETWARNFSSPFEVSPRRERERTERLRAQLRNSRASALVRTFSSGSQSAARDVTIKTEPGLATGASTLGAQVTTKPSFASPTGHARHSLSVPPRSLSPLSDAFRPPPAPTPFGKDAHVMHMKRFVPHNPHAIEALAIGRKTSDRVYVLPLFGDELPPVKTEVSAKIFHFLTNADVYNASLVNRLWSRVTMGDSVWDHHNFRRLPSHLLTEAEVAHHHDHSDVMMQD